MAGSRITLDTVSTDDAAQLFAALTAPIADWHYDGPWTVYDGDGTPLSSELASDDEGCGCGIVPSSACQHADDCKVAALGCFHHWAPPISRPRSGATS